MNFDSFKMSIMEEPIGTTYSHPNGDIITLADLKRFHTMLK